jgi:hypothetical protein
MATERRDMAICAACGTAFPKSSPACTRCGVPVMPPPVAREPGLLRALLDNPWFVLVLLFFVMAILGLPVLWISRGFSVAAKIVLSVLVALYTALLFWLTWLIIAWSYASMMRSLR